MYKFKNMTTSDQFDKTISFWNNKITEVSEYKWKITDNCGNKWDLVYNPNDKLFSISNDDEPFCVQVSFNGQEIKIIQAECKGKKLKSERMLKKFAEISMMTSCFYQFGNIKIA